MDRQKSFPLKGGSTHFGTQAERRRRRARTLCFIGRHRAVTEQRRKRAHSKMRGLLMVRRPAITKDAGELEGLDADRIPLVAPEDHEVVLCVPPYNETHMAVYRATFKDNDASEGDSRKLLAPLEIGPGCRRTAGPDARFLQNAPDKASAPRRFIVREWRADSCPPPDNQGVRLEPRIFFLPDILTGSCEPSGFVQNSGFSPRTRKVADARSTAPPELFVRVM